MKKYNLSNIMKKAWWFFRNSKSVSTFSDALRKAWAIAKQSIQTAKKAFTGSANVNGYEFNLWEKYGKRRIYINNYSGSNRSNNGGYIDLDHENAIHAVGSVKFAALEFLKAYEF
jgi:hypothetical protein